MSTEIAAEYFSYNLILVRVPVGSFRFWDNICTTVIRQLMQINTHGSRKIPFVHDEMRSSKEWAIIGTIWCWINQDPLK